MQGIYAFTLILSFLRVPDDFFIKKREIVFRYHFVQMVLYGKTFVRKGIPQTILCPYTNQKRCCMATVAFKYRIYLRKQKCEGCDSNA